MKPRFLASMECVTTLMVAMNVTVMTLVMKGTIVKKVSILINVHSIFLIES